MPNSSTLLSVFKVWSSKTRGTLSGQSDVVSAFCKLLTAQISIISICSTHVQIFLCVSRWGVQASLPSLWHHRPAGHGRRQGHRRQDESCVTLPTILAPLFILCDSGVLLLFQRGCRLLSVVALPPSPCCVCGYFFFCMQAENESGSLMSHSLFFPYEVYDSQAWRRFSLWGGTLSPETLCTHSTSAIQLYILCTHSAWKSHGYYSKEKLRVPIILVRLSSKMRQIFPILASFFINKPFFF